MFSVGFPGRGGPGNVWEGPYMPGENFWNQGINNKRNQNKTNFSKIDMTHHLRGAMDPALAL